ncbi:MAG: hypothetical protein ACRYF4_10335 [Janthinobacterium lividum]
MGLDLRIPLGLMFATIGLLMVGYGAFTWQSAMYQRSMGQNVNVIWGGTMLLFGLVMLLLARRSKGAEAKVESAASAVPRRTH